MLKVTFWKTYWVRRAILVSGVMILIISPLIAFAVQQPDQFFHRSNQVSITNEFIRGEQSVFEAFIDNFKTYAGMFQLRGDHNGRHNIPNQPMLDFVTGILFVTGLLLGWRYRGSLIFYLVLLFALITGALTIPSEAPNVLRSIVAIVPVSYFCTCTLVALTQLLTGRLSWGIMIAICLCVIVLNIRSYFVEFANNYDCFIAFSVEDTIRGRLIDDRQQAGHHIYLPNRQFFGTTQSFNAPNLYLQSGYELAEPHPIPIVFEQPVTIFLNPNEHEWLWEIAKAVHPEATYTIITANDYGIVIEIHFSTSLIFFQSKKT